MSFVLCDIKFIIIRFWTAVDAKQTIWGCHHELKETVINWEINWQIKR